MGQTAFFASPIPPSFDLPTVKWGSLIKWNVSLYGFIFLRKPPTPPVTYQPVFHNMNHLPACNSLFQCCQTLSPFLMLEVSRELQSATCKVKFTHPAGLSSIFSAFSIKGTGVLNGKAIQSAQEKTQEQILPKPWDTTIEKIIGNFKFLFVCAFCCKGRVSWIPFKIGTVCFSPTNLICSPHPSLPPGSLRSFKVTVEVSPLCVQTPWHSSCREH